MIHMSVIAPLKLRALFDHVLDRLWKLENIADNHCSAAGSQWELGKGLRVVDISCMYCLYFLYCTYHAVDSEWDVPCCRATPKKEMLISTFGFVDTHQVHTTNRNVKSRLLNGHGW